MCVLPVALQWEKRDEISAFSRTHYAVEFGRIWFLEIQKFRNLVFKISFMGPKK